MTRTFVLSLLVALFCLPSALQAQVEYIMFQGDVSAETQGPNPFATVVKNQRSQYLYIGNELMQQDAPAGFITAVSLNITDLAIPSTLKPENLQIKMGLTNEVLVPVTLFPNLAVYYSKAEENINALGWYTFTLDTPFEWDGYSNILVEFCRTNETSGTSFSVEIGINEVGAYRMAALMSDAVNSNGCTLTGTTPITLPNRRLTPSFKVTMIDPCSGTPIAGTVVVSDGDHCSEPFTLSVANGSIESGLSYQWQSTTTIDGEYTDIVGATSSSYTTSQDFATYYRRAITCDESQITAFSIGLLVAGEGCYCNPTVTTMDATGITNVTFNTINNTSESTPAYTNFKSETTAVQRNNTFDLSAMVTSVGTSLNTKAWIDWNQDEVFDASESYDLGFVASGTNVSSGMMAAVVVPVDAVLGNTVMRVRTANIDDLAMLEPCGNTANGEAEDYTIVVEEELGLTDSDLVNASIVVISNESTLNIRSTSEAIAGIKVYDLRGRVLYNKSGLNEMQSSVQLNSVASQLLIVEVKTVSGLLVNKKVSVK